MVPSLVTLVLTCGHALKMIKIDPESENLYVKKSAPELHHQLWEFYNTIAMKDTRYNAWLAEGTNHITSSILFAYEENYDKLLTNYCVNLDPSEVPNKTRFDVGKMKGRRFKNDCPTSDPGYAAHGKILMASGLNCPMPQKCVPTDWLKDLEHTFYDNAKHLTKQDLFQKDVCNVAYVERQGNEVLHYPNYRHGLQVDFLIDQGHLSGAKKETIMEIGAGLALFAGIVKKKSAATRYVIMDIPTSLPLQINYLHSLGYSKIILASDQLMKNIHNVMKNVDFDFLIILPHHLSSMPDASIDVTVNFDSMVEMPKMVIEHYVTQVSRVSNAFYTVNKPYAEWRTFTKAIDKNFGNFTKVVEKQQVRPRGFNHQTAGLWFFVGMDGEYEELYYKRS